MLPLIPYIIKVVIVSAIMFGYYWIVLRNKKFHHFNRFYLLSAIVLPLIIPFISLESLLPIEGQTVPLVFSRDVVMDNIVITVYGDSYWNTEHILNGLYLLVTGLLFVWFLYSLYKILWITRECESIKIDGILLVQTKVKGTPFSFFKKIFWNPDLDLRSDEGAKMLNHELTHCRQWHTLDKMVVKIICCLFWFNPVFWLIRNELYLIHEFLADKNSFQTDSASFSRIVLREIYPGYSWSLTNSFFYSPIKRRITMLLKNNHQKVNYLGRLLVLPLAAGLFVFFTMKANARVDAHDLDMAKVDTIPASGEISNVKIEQVVVITNKDGSKKTMTMEEAKKAGIVVPQPPPPPPGVTAPTPPPKGIVPPQPGTAVPAPPHDGIVSPPPAPPAPLTLGSLPDNVMVVVDGKEVDKSSVNQIAPDQIQSVSVFKGNNAVDKYGVKARSGVIEITTKSSSSGVNGVSGPELNQLQNDTIPPALDKIFTKTEVEASFPGGQESWRRYITRIISEHIKELTKDDYGTCIVKFIIDTKGNVHDVAATTMKGTKLAEIAENAIRKGPKWIPAQQNGRYVNAYRLQPVTVKKP